VSAVASPRLAGALAGGLLLLAGCGGSPADDPVAPPGGASFAGTRLDGASPIPDFVLSDQDGRPARLSEQRGRFVLVTFLYTNCPDVCPLIAGRLNHVLRGLGDARRSVRVLAVSVDPRGDTRDAVRVYSRRHRLVPEFRYLIGTYDELAPVWQSFNALVEPREHVLVQHAAPIYLLDRRGRPLLVYESDIRTGALARDLRLLGIAG
jgi:protein SCO1/2